MAQNSQHTIPTDKFLTIAVNLLHRQFIDTTRTQAKQVYREIETGRAQGMTTVKMEDESTVRFSVALDSSEFQGQLNFGAFKASLSTLLGNLVRALQEKTEVTVFSIEGSSDSVLFGITGVTVADERPNVMVLGSDVGQEVGAMTLRLMYLNPEQFLRQDGDRVTGIPA
jgi:hypothetical protein